MICISQNFLLTDWRMTGLNDSTSRVWVRKAMILRKEAPAMLILCPSSSRLDGWKQNIGSAESSWFYSSDRSKWRLVSNGSPDQLTWSISHCIKPYTDTSKTMITFHLEMLLTINIFKDTLSNPDFFIQWG